MRLNLKGYSGAGPRGHATPLLCRGRRDRADQPDRERLQQGALPGAADQPGAQQRGGRVPASGTLRVSSFGWGDLYFLTVDTCVESAAIVSLVGSLWSIQIVFIDSLSTYNDQIYLVQSSFVTVLTNMLWINNSIITSGLFGALWGYLNQLFQGLL